ncbi:MAG: DUF748 domain-containing protein [Desulfuromonadales bacterium]|nr:DUF748 domain-containing protein [Desulfuromonadales bacterium]MBN2791494.1 DUF748 domain-containing protein [Desulfuromonadales bacterium]
MPRGIKITLISFAVILSLLLLSMLIVPWQIKKQGSNWISENTNRNLTIEKAYFNPFTLSVQLRNLKLTEQNSTDPFVSFDRLKLSVSVRSLVDQALILDRVELDNPFVNLALLGKQTYNFSDFTELGGKQQDGPKEVSETTEPFLFSLNNIVVIGGSLNFTDQTSEKKSQHQIRELELRVPFVGNIPYLADRYVQPYLHMLLNGSTFEAKGQTKPFHDSLETSINLTLSAIDLAFYAYHSPVPLPIDVRQGVLDADLQLDYRVSSTHDPTLNLGGEITLSDIDLRELDGRDLFRLAKLQLDLDWAELFKQDFNLKAVTLDDPEVFIDRDSSGRWNVQRIQSHLGQKSAQAEIQEEQTSEGNSTAAALPLLFVEQLKLNNGQLHFRDDAVVEGFSEEIKAITLNLAGLSTHYDQQTEASFSLQTGRDLSVTINGGFALNPTRATLDVSAGQLQLEPLYPYLEPFLTSSLKGHLTMAGQIEYTSDGNLLVRNGQARLEELQVPFVADDRFLLGSLDIGASTFDLAGKQLIVGTLRLSNGDLALSKLKEGDFSPLKLLKQTEQENPTAPPTDPVKNDTENPWNFAVNSFDLENFKLLFTDHSLTKQPQVNISRFDAQLANLSYPQARESSFNLAAKLGRKGEVNIAGTAVHTPLALTAQTQIKEFPLADFNAFIPDNIKLNLKSGQLFTTADLNLKQQGEKLSGHFSGTTTISNFNLRDPLEDGELLSWNTLNLNGIEGDLAPFTLHIKDVALSKYTANIMISKDGRINLASVTAQTESTENEQVQDAEKEIDVPTTTEVNETSTNPPADIRIDNLTLQGGTVAFVDRSMDTLFSTTMHELGGRVTGMASDEQMLADVDLRGQLENHSPLTISGKINPLSKDLFADLTISFKDIDLTPLTPYSGTYLGYVIDKGKLYLDLSYHIEKRKIKADNKVIIDQFTLGDSVKSDKATSLPIGLAIALLKDANDEIHLDVPVFGDLDDPDFSVAGVIFTVIKNLLVKAATSPFSLLSSLLGSGDQDFTSVTFAPGLATIDPEQLEQLQKLAEMLAQRPSLTLEISAFADRDNDPESYRQEQLRRMLVEARWQQLVEAGTAPETKDQVVINPEEYPEVILRVYKEADFPRPRNFVGMLEKLPVEEMEKLLLANIRAGEEEIAELAKMRALNVRDALVSANEEIKPRLFLLQPDIYTLPEDGPASRVEFKISVK